MSTLAQLRTRVLLALLDTGSAIYTADLVDECMRQALQEYSNVLPQELDTVVDVLADGREVDLSGVTGLVNVHRVYWPYDSSASEETWPPNRVRGWEVYWNGTDPVLYFTQWDGDQPQADDEARIWYSARQTIQDLDSEAVTSVRFEHETLLVQGAAGYAAMSRAEDLIETAGTDLYQVSLLGSWAVKMLRVFQQGLAGLQQTEVRSGPAWGEGWALDKWDSSR